MLHSILVSYIVLCALNTVMLICIYKNVASVYYQRYWYSYTYEVAASGTRYTTYIASNK